MATIWSVLQLETYILMVIEAYVMPELIGCDVTCKYISKYTKNTLEKHYFNNFNIFR